MPVVEYSCLGDWFVGKDHFFAVANTKESRKDEKGGARLDLHCFLPQKKKHLTISFTNFDCE